jgi:hypothetical protein
VSERKGAAWMRFNLEEKTWVKTIYSGYVFVFKLRQW